MYPTRQFPSPFSAWAANGSAAAPPISPMNSRRFAAAAALDWLLHASMMRLAIFVVHPNLDVAKKQYPDFKRAFAEKGHDACIAPAVYPVVADC
jgi:hypothetical protein